MNRGQFEVNEISLEDWQNPPSDCRVLRVLAYRKMYRTDEGFESVTPSCFKVRAAAIFRHRTKRHTRR